MNYLFRNNNIFVFPERQDQPLNLVGNNKKAVLVIFRARETADQLMTFLGKVLGAVQLNVEEDIHCLNITNHSSISFSKLSSTPPYQQVIIFGAEPEELGLHFDHRLYQPIHLGNTTFLFADELQEIFEERRQGKKKMAGALWKALQSIFLKA